MNENPSISLPEAEKALDLIDAHSRMTSMNMHVRFELMRVAGEEGLDALRRRIGELHPRN